MSLLNNLIAKKINPTQDKIPTMSYFAYTSNTAHNEPDEEDDHDALATDDAAAATRLEPSDHNTSPPRGSVPLMDMPERRRWCQKAIENGTHPGILDPQRARVFAPAQRKSSSVCELHGLRVLDYNGAKEIVHFFCLTDECAGPQCHGHKVRINATSTNWATTHLWDVHGIVSARKEAREMNLLKRGSTHSTKRNIRPSLLVLASGSNSSDKKQRGRLKRGQDCDDINDDDNDDEHYEHTIDVEEEAEHDEEEADRGLQRLRSPAAALVGKRRAKKAKNNTSQLGSFSLKVLQDHAKRLRAELLTTRTKLDRITAEDDKAKDELFTLSDELARAEMGQPTQSFLHHPSDLRSRLKVVRATLVRSEKLKNSLTLALKELRNELYETELDIARAEQVHERGSSRKANAAAAAAATAKAPKALLRVATAAATVEDPLEQLGHANEVE